MECQTREAFDQMEKALADALGLLRDVNARIAAVDARIALLYERMGHAEPNETITVPARPTREQVLAFMATAFRNVPEDQFSPEFAAAVMDDLGDGLAALSRTLNEGG